MRFQTKMVLVYTMFVLGVTVALGFFYYKYNYIQLEKTEENNLKIAANQLVTQMEDVLSPMELAMDYVLSDTGVLNGIYTLSNIERQSIGEDYREEAEKAVTEGIRTQYLSYNFYRTMYFNSTGFVVSTYSSSKNLVRGQAELEKMPWIEATENRKGRPLIVNAHEDVWSPDSDTQIFSLIKRIQGDDRGYIEIQNEVSLLDERLKVGKEGIEFQIYINDGELLYSSSKENGNEVYQSLKDDATEKVQKVNSKDGENLVLKSSSNNFNITVIAMENSKLIRKEGVSMTLMTAFVAGIFFLFSMIFVLLLSYYLTKPIRQLREIMEQTKLENMSGNVHVQTPHDEIEALGISYQNVLERLQQAIVKEKRLSLLQLQAQYDLLQAQVNPHFLYNVLNVIAARGAIGGDEEICEMCGSLAKMLRYSTNTINRYATIEEEIGYLDQYFYLLQSRYEHKLEYQIDIAKEIRTQIVPKIALQQIVENCINHGFENYAGKMRIKITGYREGNQWFVSIHDNGQGFQEEVLNRLNETFEKTREKMFNERNMEMEIGGMGLVNTYSRLLLLYNDKLTFQLYNIEDGAEVLIGGDFQGQTEAGTGGADVL